MNHARLAVWQERSLPPVEGLRSWLLDQRALRRTALGRKQWLFAGSERGGDRAAFMYTLIVSCRMNDIDPKAWMAHILARMPDIILSRLPELLPWTSKAQQQAVKAA